MLRDPMAVQSWGQGGTRRRLLRGVVALPWLSAMGAGAAWAARPARIVSLGGALTEVVYLLGAQGQLVGTDTTSLFPEAALRTAKVGYMRQLSAEGLLSLQPDAVVGTTEAGPPVVLDQVRSAGVRVELVDADHTWDEVRRKVATVGRVAGREREAQALQADLDEQWAAVHKLVAAATRRPAWFGLLRARSLPCRHLASPDLRVVPVGRLRLGPAAAGAALATFGRLLMHVVV